MLSDSATVQFEYYNSKKGPYIRSLLSLSPLWWEEAVQQHAGTKRGRNKKSMKDLPPDNVCRWNVRGQIVRKKNTDHTVATLSYRTNKFGLLGGEGTFDDLVKVLGEHAVPPPTDDKQYVSMNYETFISVLKTTFCREMSEELGICIEHDQCTVLSNARFQVFEDCYYPTLYFFVRAEVTASFEVIQQAHEALLHSTTGTEVPRICNMSVAHADLRLPAPMKFLATCAAAQTRSMSK
jgi:hypothetical protein